MVHALEKLHRLLGPGGCLIDIHPSSVPATVEVHAGGSARAAGVVREPQGVLDYERAETALTDVVRRGLFAVEHQESFPFIRYADTLDELLDHLAETWKDASLDAATRSRVRSFVTDATGRTTVAVHEIARIARFRKI